MKYAVYDFSQSRMIASGFDTIEEANAWVKERRIDPIMVGVMSFYPIEP